jgi:hypothetical protein
LYEGRLFFDEHPLTLYEVEWQKLNTLNLFRLEKQIEHYFESKAEKKIVEKRDLFATKEDLANLKAEIIKWMFIFWIGQLGALVAIIKLLG